MWDGWFLVLLLVAEVLGTVGGFGSSMLVMPLMAFFLPFDQALGLTALFHVFSNAAKIILFRKGLSKKLLLSMGVPAVIGVLIGARLTAFIPGEHMMLVLSAVLIVLSVLILFVPDQRVEATTLNASMGGAASGFVAGLVGTGGAIRGLTLAAFDLPKEVFISTSAWIDMGVDLSRTVVYAQQGFIAQSTWAYLPWLAAISLLGSWAGRWLLGRVPQERFRKLVLVLVIAVAVYSAVRAAMEIVGK
ncbi:MAG: sulfite exporter TauE/SafE family protein [Flavobacteriales bacterium]|nr:sulfite exporter TauE/SafE family protein [Flavobacteriales bacterium]